MSCDEPYAISKLSGVKPFCRFGRLTACSSSSFWWGSCREGP